ncbi:MAG TPA: glutaredoxin family protein [Pyrinomonadaceae bacterium]|nr:glutaredoxin family protein [Pyrinomonadaceae bacterium]
MSEKAHVIIYTRPGCHLCDQAKRIILREALTEQFILEEVNIDCNPELKERFRYEIPVIFINGEEAFRHRLTAEEFRERLKSL